MGVRRGVSTLDLLTGQEGFIAADSLVLATGNQADILIADALRTRGTALTLIGDEAAPRQAAYSIFKERKAALSI